MLKILKWVMIMLVVAFVALVVGRMIFFIQRDKTEAQVERIHNTKLTLGDVRGDNLPPAPEKPDETVVGVDENKNGIRDDVELAIFAAYPNSARTRAVLLQYALALQMEVTQEMVNTGTVIAVAQDGDRAYSCVGEILPRDNLSKYIEQSGNLRTFVETKQFNTEKRKQAHNDFYKGNLNSYSSPNEGCDIDLSTLPN